MFSFGVLLVHEKEYRFICRCIWEDGKHDRKQSLAQGSRAALGDGAGLRIEVSGLERRSVNACKANKCVIYNANTLHIRKSGACTDMAADMIQHINSMFDYFIGGTLVLMAVILMSKTTLKKKKLNCSIEIRCSVVKRAPHKKNCP